MEAGVYAKVEWKPASLSVEGLSKYNHTAPWESLEDILVLVNGFPHG